MNRVKTLISTQAGLFYPVASKGHDVSAPGSISQAFSEEKVVSCQNEKKRIASSRMWPWEIIFGNISIFSISAHECHDGQLVQLHVE